MKITKGSVGTKVWLVPTGNNYARGKNSVSSLNQAKEAEITKMARIKGEFKFVDSSFPQSFSIADYSDNEIKQGDNAGYVVYGSFDEIESAIKASRVRDYLRDNYQELSVEKLLKVGFALSLDLAN